MKRLRVPPKTLFVLLIAITILCRPIANYFNYRFQFAELGEAWHPLAVTLRSVPSYSFWIWLLIALLSPLVTGFILFDWRLRERGHLWLAALTVWVLSWGSILMSISDENTRHAGLTRITQRGKPIIAAIEKYHTDKDKYPAKLESLVPDYLAEIPSTGVVGYPKFEYMLADTTMSKEYPNDYSKKYALFVSTPQLTPFDVQADYFVYWPEKQYPDSIFDGFALYRVGDWAYAEYIT